MASQSCIIAREAIIIEACKQARQAQPDDLIDLQAELTTRVALLEATEAYTIEIAQGGNPANRDCWGTLWVNIETLNRLSPRMHEYCKPFLDVASRNFLTTHGK